MKRLILAFALAIAAKTAVAGDLPAGNAYFTVNYTTNITGLSTNNFNVVTNYCEDSLYHTFSFTSTSNLNGATVQIQFGPDGTNWNTWGTIGVAATAGSALNVNTNVVFKQSYYRWILTSTNFAGKITYLGGR